MTITIRHHKPLRDVTLRFPPVPQIPGVFVSLEALDLPVCRHCHRPTCPLLASTITGWDTWREAVRECYWAQRRKA